MIVFIVQTLGIEPQKFAAVTPIGPIWFATLAEAESFRDGVMREFEALQAERQQSAGFTGFNRN